MEKVTWNEVRIQLMEELHKNEDMRKDYWQFKSKVSVILGIVTFFSSVSFIAFITALINKLFGVH